MMLFLVGPTSVGKSAVALELAPLLKGEIVVADSMQVYRHLDVATAKPTIQEQSQIVHHTLDLVEPAIPFSVADWLTHAQQAIQKIQQKGKIPLIVGGTGLYIQAIRKGLSPNPGTSIEMKEKLAQLSLSELIDHLTQLNPQASQLIDLKNRRRVERALAILQQGGTLHSAHWQEAQPNLLSPIYGLARSREDLTQRINERVEKMLKTGLIEEYLKFVEDHLPLEATAWQALGYRQIKAYRAGEMSYEACVNRIKTETRQYAKRQMTWFKRDLDIQWISLSSEATPAMTAQQIYNDYSAKLNLL